MKNDFYSIKKDGWYKELTGTLIVLLFVGCVCFVTNLSASTIMCQINPYKFNLKGKQSIDTTVAKQSTVILDPPYFSYPAAPRYYLNKPGTVLKPTSVNSAYLAFAKIPVAVGSGYTGPSSVAIDLIGNIYIADKNSNQVKKINFFDFMPVAINFGSGFNHPSGVAVDSAGNVYVADQGNNMIKKLPEDGTSFVTLGSGFNAPSGITVDAQGNVYVADKGNNAVKMIPASGGSPVALGSGFNAPASVAIDAAGNIYVTDEGSRTVKKIAAGTHTPTNFGSGFQHPLGIAVDDIGNVYVSDIGNNTVKKFPANGGSPVELGSGFKTPEGITIDAVGSVFVADKGNNALKKIRPIGGYFISSALPLGLIFNRSTGVISGTPKKISPPKNYSITAWNSYGSASRDLLIGVYDNFKPVNLSYSTPHSFVENAVIDPLIPTSGGVAPFGYSTKSATVAGGFGSTADIAFDKEGNLYVSDLIESKIYKILATGGPRITVESGFKAADITVDSAGNVFGMNSTTIMKFPAGGGASITIGSGLTAITGIAANAAGDLFVITDNYGVVFKIVAGSTKPLPFFTSDNIFTNTIAVDPAGNVYVGSFYSGGMTKILPNGVGTDRFPVVGINATSIAVDASGNVFSASEGSPDGGHPGGREVVTSNHVEVPLNVIDGALAVDARGNLYVAGGGVVRKVRPVGGYYINQALPEGLIFNSFTGVISGTPTKAQPAKNYNITAYNDFSKNSGIVNLAVIKNPQPITVSYKTPQNYIKGITISPLIPTVKGVDLPDYSTSGIAIARNFEFAYDLALDGAGNIYAAIPQEKKIIKIFKDGRPPVLIESGFQALDIAVDFAGNVYGVDEKVLKKISYPGQEPVTVNSGLTAPSGVAIDVNGNVYVVGHGSKTIYKIPSGGGSPLAFAKLENAPSSIAIDIEGNLYAGVFLGGAIEKIPAKGGAHVYLPVIGINAIHIETDPSGNVYASSEGSPDGGTPGGLEMFKAGGGHVTIHKLGTGIAVDTVGNLYINSAGTISVIQPVGGYFISGALPAGLNFNNTTGVISGTPTKNNPRKNYYVTAYNSFGASTPATIDIAVALQTPGLASLRTSSGTMTPSFTPDITSYTVSVTSTTTAIKVTPVANEHDAYISVNNKTVTSGTESANFMLVAGNNIIKTVISGKAGITKTYVLKVTKPDSSFDGNALTTLKTKYTQALSVYPNPNVSGGQLNLTLKNFKRQENVTIHLFDMMGAKLKTVNIKTDANGSFNTILQLPQSSMSHFFVVRAVSAFKVKEAKVITQ